MGKTSELLYNADGYSKRMLVYTPSGYDGKGLPTLYLTHGISQTEDSWEELCGVTEIFDSCISKGITKPFAAVMVNGRACEEGKKPDDSYGLENVRLFLDFEKEFISVILPTVEEHFGTVPDREHRAVAGFSMGGFQSVNFGLAHADKFAYIGGFSPAPYTDAKTSANSFLMNNKSAKLSDYVRLFYLSNGTLETDGEGKFGQFKKYTTSALEYMQNQGVNCVYETFEGGHEPIVWERSLRSFVKRLWK